MDELRENELREKLTRTTAADPAAEASDPAADTGADAGPEQGRSDAQPALPLELGHDEVAGAGAATHVQPLPFDDEADRPVGMTLTARAKRVVASEALPALRVVTDAPGTGTRTEDPSDTRPSRARAMRRAGRTPARIAEQLGVDELLVRAWVEDVGPRRSRRNSPRSDDAEGSSGGSDAARAAADRQALATAQARHPSQAGRQMAKAQGEEQHRAAYELARATARDEARRRHLADPAFAGGIGLLAGVAEVDPHAVTITTVDGGIASAALRWLRSHLEIEPSRIRLVLRIGPRVAGDLAAHRWSRDLGVPRESVAVASWRHAPGDEAEQVLLRIADPTVAATVAGWRDALLAPPGDDPADIAF